MVFVCYSPILTCLAFVAVLLPLLLFAVLCFLLLRGHNTTPGWLYHPEGGDFKKQGSLNFPKGWFYHPKGLVSSFLKADIKPPGVVLRAILSPIWWWFYARAPRERAGGLAFAWQEIRQ